MLSIDIKYCPICDMHIMQYYGDLAVNLLSAPNQMEGLKAGVPTKLGEAVGSVSFMLNILLIIQYDRVDCCLFLV